MPACWTPPAYGTSNSQNYATEAISGLEDTNLTEAITRLNADQTLLQASYLSLSRLDSISLVDFLR